MSADERPLREVGRIIRAHGLKGDVLVDLWTDRVERMAPGSELATPRGVLVVAEAAAHQDRYIVRFEGLVTRADAERWHGVVLSAPRIHDDDAIWIDELFGAEVVDASGVSRGVVVGVESNPACDLLVLDSGALVPLTFVTRVRANERIDVEAPDGLFG